MNAESVFSIEDVNVRRSLSFGSRLPLLVVVWKKREERVRHVMLRFCRFTSPPFFTFVFLAYYFVLKLKKHTWPRDTLLKYAGFECLGRKFPETFSTF